MRFEPRGVTLLLEVLIGFTIFLSALLFVFGVFTMSHRLSTSTKNLAVASNLAREVMETQVVRGYAGVVKTPDIVIPMPATVNGVATSTLFTAKIDVTDEAAAAAPNNYRRKRVVVTISWSEGNGVTRSTKLETYVIE